MSVETKMKEEKLENLVKAFAEAKKNPLLIDLEEYEEMVIGNYQEGRIGECLCHADICVDFYVNENPYHPGKKGNSPQFDAVKKAYELGIAIKEFAECIREEAG
jgi:hypothetical protein